MLNNRRRGGSNGGNDEMSASNNGSFSLDRRHYWSNPSRQLKHINTPSTGVAIHTETTIRLDGDDSVLPPSRDFLPKHPVLPSLS